jgi:nitrate reductase gamma subunit
MLSIPQIATYISYIFVIIAYTVKVMKIVRMPPHLRWELYPVPHESAYRYGGSYYEELDWWTRPRQQNLLRDILYKLKDYFTFPSYYRRNKWYWVGLICWHVGFYTIVSFHILSFFGALFIVTTGMEISATPHNPIGLGIYYLTLVIGAASFILGAIGSTVLLIKRATDPELRAYSTPSAYFNYIFFLVMFVSGLVAWVFFDPTFSAYREFWQNLITLHYFVPEWATYAHIMLFSFFLIYLPFTRSTHYITNIFAFFDVLWDDAPNRRDEMTDRRIGEALAQKVSWSAPHIGKGKTWAEVASAMPEDTGRTGK